MWTEAYVKPTRRKRLKWWFQRAGVRLRNAWRALRGPGRLRTRLRDAWARLFDPHRTLLTFQPPLIRRVWPRTYFQDIVPTLPIPSVLSDEQRAGMEFQRAPWDRLEDPFAPGADPNGVLVRSVRVPGPTIPHVETIEGRKLRICFPSCRYGEDGLCVGCALPRPREGEE